MSRSSFAARLTSLAVVALAAAALAAPALATGSRAASTAVTVTATDFHFKLSRTSAPHGAIVFTLVNKGHTMHDFKIGGKKTPLISPGHRATLRVTLKKGKYAYLCTFPGHAALGMKGTFVVK
jgi:plastocyanin